ncbi:hypothetical protein AXG55_11185 [Silvanigrella aquatica]|uniref:Uncharacterized protein n=1 Tax=Silvanigrella aquatica TaxID=1915309 RepID=A0A1L4D2L1_9BACT|nr:hypothetical protein AXG55_11185 [Silvanigrella aquatica]
MEKDNFFLNFSMLSIQFSPRFKRSDSDSIIIVSQRQALHNFGTISNPIVKSKKTFKIPS